MSSRRSIRSAKRVSISSSAIGAASRIRACARSRQARPPPGTARAPAARRDRRSRRVRWRAGTRRPARGSWRCGRDRPAPAPRWATGRPAPHPCRPPPPPSARHAPGVFATARAVAAETSSRFVEIDAVAAEPALGQDRRDLGAEQSGPRLRPASTTMRASRGGSGRRRSLRPSSVMRPCASMAPSSASSERASASAPARRRIEERKRRRIADAPGSRRSSSKPDRSAARISGSAKAPATPSAARPTAGSRRPARCGRRGRGAGRPRRARRARSRAASARRPARSAARGRARVDHDAHALDGERGLGDRGRQHHLAPARRARAIARSCVAHPARRRAARYRPPGSAMRSCAALGAADLRLPRQEGQHRARLGASARAPRPPPAARSAGADRGRDSASRPERPGPRSRSPAHRRAASRRARRRASPTSRGCAGPRAAPPARRAPAPGRDRHRASARGTRRTAPRRRRRAPDRRDHAGEDALGHDLDAGARADLASRSARDSRPCRRRVSPSVARHALGGGARGEPARLQHEDAPALRPGSSSSASGTRVVLPAPGGATSTAATMCW
jgi:hypothetical protein